MKRVTQGTTLWNYSKFWPAVSEKIFKEFLHICLVQKVSPPWWPCLSMDQNFSNKFWKGSPKEQSCEIISKSDQGFKRKRFFKNFFMSVLCKKPPQPLFIRRIKISRIIFEKGHPKDNLWNNFKIGPAVSEDKIFKEFLKKFHLVTMATRVFDGIKFCKQFWRGPPKKHSCQVWFKLAQRSRRSWCLKKLLMAQDGQRKTDNGHRVILKAPVEHVVFRWAKKIAASKSENTWHSKISVCHCPITGTSLWLQALFKAFIITLSWLVVLGFNATLTAKVVSWSLWHTTFPGFLTPEY